MFVLQRLVEKITPSYRIARKDSGNESPSAKKAILVKKIIQQLSEEKICLQFLFLLNE